MSTEVFRKGGLKMEVGLEKLKHVINTTVKVLESVSFKCSMTDI